jgi:hypothetical protein
MALEAANGAAESTADAQRREVAARVRAAMGYAGLKLDDIAARCELVTPANIRRTVGARRDTPTAELVQIATACGVPWSWFESGVWDTTTAAEAPELRFGEGSVDQRVLVLETYVALMARALSTLGIDELPQPLPDGRLPSPRERRQTPTP